VTISSCSSPFCPSSSPFVTIHCRFGGTDGRCHYSDTWLFDVSTRKCTELQCTGYIPSPREDHAAALVDDVTYVLSGRGVDGTDLGDLQPMGVDDRPRYVPQRQEDDYSECSTLYHGTLVAPDTSSEITLTRLEHERIADLEQQLSETLSMQFERDQHISQLTNQLNTLLERVEAEAKKRAGPEQRGLQAKPRDHALEQARSALQKASRAVEANNEQNQRELTGIRDELEARKSESAAFRSRLADLENGHTNSRAEAEYLDGVKHRLATVEAKVEELLRTARTIENMECRND
jgi:hypothetical protein